MNRPKILIFMVLGSLLLISCTNAAPTLAPTPTAIPIPALTPASVQSNPPILVVPGEVTTIPTTPVVGKRVLVLFGIKNVGAVDSPVMHWYTKQADGFGEPVDVVGGDLKACTGSTVLQPGQSCLSAYAFQFPTPGPKEMEVALFNPLNPTKQIPKIILRFTINVVPVNVVLPVN